MRRLGWDPNPTMTGIPAWRPNPTPEYLAHYEQVMGEKYARYAASLDETHPFWHLQILTVGHPNERLAELARQRRDKELNQ